MANENRKATLSIDEIFARARARYATIKSIRVSYRVSWKQVFQIPTDDTQYELRDSETTVTFEGERRKLIYNIFEGDRCLETDPSGFLSVFDGSSSFFLRNGSIAELSKGKHREVDQRDSYCNNAIDFEVSDFARANRAWPFPESLAPGFERRADYEVLPEQELIDGAWCHVIAAGGFDKLWIDPAIGCAYRKRERHISTEESPNEWPKAFVIKTADFVDAGDGVMMPRLVTVEFYPRPIFPKQIWNRTNLVSTLTVSEIAVNEVTEDDFRISLPPGSLLMDVDKAEVYCIPGNELNTIDGLVKGLKKVSGNFFGPATDG